MTTNYQNASRFVWSGLSTDTKPTSAEAITNDLALETDTKAVYRWTGSAWEVMTPGALAVPQLLFSLTSANLNITTDQSFTRRSTFTTYHIDKVLARWVSGNSTSAAGGIYTDASKAGSALVAAAQTWDLIASANKIKVATRAAVNDTDAQTATPILSLTTAAGAAAVANIYIIGTPLA